MLDRVSVVGDRLIPGRIGDDLSGLPNELVGRILALITDHRSLALLSCASKRWSVIAADDALWRPLFLAKWSIPRRLARHSALTDRHAKRSETCDSQLRSLSITEVAWKKLFEYRLAIEHRWRKGEPTVRKIPLPGGSIVGVHPDFVVASFSSNEARILRRSDWACLQTFQVPATSVECADVAVDGATLLTGLGDYTVRLWDATTGECELFFETPRTNFNLHRRVRLFGDHILLVDFVGNIKVWDRFTGELTLSFARDDHNFVDWDATADGLISLSLDGCIHLWNFATRLCCVVVLGDENAHPRVGRIVSDGKRVAVNWHHDGPRGGTDVWDFETGDIIVNLSVSSLNAIHLIGNLLVGALSVARKIQLWDIETGQNIRCFNFDAFSSISAQVSCSALFLSESIRGRASDAAVLDFGEDIPFATEF